MTDKKLLQQALDALETHVAPYPSVDAKHYKAAYSAMDALRAAIAQPESEPVATVRAKSDAYGGAFVHWTTVPVAGMKLYAAPVQPAYVPLTNDQIVGFLETAGFDDLDPSKIFAFARAIEKHSNRTNVMRKLK